MCCVGDGAGRNSLRRSTDGHKRCIQHSVRAQMHCNAPTWIDPNRPRPASSRSATWRTEGRSTRSRRASLGWESAAARSSATGGSPATRCAVTWIDPSCPPTECRVVPPLRVGGRAGDLRLGSLDRSKPGAGRCKLTSGWPSLGVVDGRAGELRRAVWIGPSSPLRCDGVLTAQVVTRCDAPPATSGSSSTGSLPRCTAMRELGSIQVARL